MTGLDLGPLLAADALATGAAGRSRRVGRHPGRESRTTWCCEPDPAGVARVGRRLPAAGRRLRAPRHAGASATCSTDPPGHRDAASRRRGAGFDHRHRTRAIAHRVVEPSVAIATTLARQTISRRPGFTTSPKAEDPAGRGASRLILYSAPTTFAPRATSVAAAAPITPSARDL